VLLISISCCWRFISCDAAAAAAASAAVTKKEQPTNIVLLLTLILENGNCQLSSLQYCFRFQVLPVYHFAHYPPRKGGKEYDDVWTGRNHVGSVYLIVISFPSTVKGREYSEEECIRWLHDSSPACLAGNFVQVKNLDLVDTVAADFQDSMYKELLSKYSTFLGM
jgi:hypothetical protein